jgi:hypothetical protein
MRESPATLKQKPSANKLGLSDQSSQLSMQFIGPAPVPAAVPPFYQGMERDTVRGAFACDMDFSALLAVTEVLCICKVFAMLDNLMAGSGAAFMLMARVV